MKNKIGRSFLLLILISCLISCQGEFTPKPKGFFRIDFPEKHYLNYDSSCPFTFEYPDYSFIEKDNYPDAQPCWINIQFAQFNGTLHISYRKLENNLRQLTEDSRSLAMKHSAKADEIDETPFISRSHIYGLRYDIKGNAASPIQFYLTDSTKHFMRASFYFNVTPQADSLAPVLKFLEKDIDHFVQTFLWK